MIFKNMKFSEYLIMSESMDDIVVGDITVPAGELRWRFDTSGGPGGQNVNKVNTKATLRWTVAASQAWIGHEDALTRFIELFKNRINKEGDLIIQSQATRNQRQNMYHCITKLGEMISQAAQPPVLRMPPKPPSAARRRKRLDAKTREKRRKQDRRANKIH